MDVYCPANATDAGGVPVALFVHGGVWAVGEPARVPPLPVQKCYSGRLLNGITIVGYPVDADLHMCGLDGQVKVVGVCAGERWQYSPLAAKMAEAGALAVVMSYTLYPDVMVPQMVDEVIAYTAVPGLCVTCSCISRAAT